MNYKIHSQGRVVIVTIPGSITKSDIPDILKCKSEIMAGELPVAVVIYFKDVKSIDMNVFRELTLLQHEIRKSNVLVRTVGLNSQIKTLLREKGVIRENESSNSLHDVLIALTKLS